VFLRCGILLVCQLLELSLGVKSLYFHHYLETFFQLALLSLELSVRRFRLFQFSLDSLQLRPQSSHFPAQIIGIM